VRVERIHSHYEERIREDRDSFDILDWGSRDSQLRRFDVLCDVLRNAGLDTVPFSLLDVGAGLTDLAGHLQERRFECAYVGADITPGIAREAKRRFPERQILLTDVLTAPPFQAGAVDATFCSGVFNLDLGNNLGFVAGALPALFGLARTVAVANFLHARTSDRYPHCFYYDPEEVIARVPPEARCVQLIDDYLENDFTLAIWH
jgi:SAM-dependent methyltransferase